VSESEKVEASSWLEAGAWLDFILGAMVLVSVAGLILKFLGR